MSKVLPRPSNIYCIGRNYLDHVKELGNAVPNPQQGPIVFLKSSASLRGLEKTDFPYADDDFHFEAEIVLRIAKDFKRGTKPSRSCIADVALGIDLTRRKEQTRLKEKGLPWTSAKSFSGSATLGTFVPLGEGIDLENIEFEFVLNGETRQQGNSKLMMFGILPILEHLLSTHDLFEGDLIFTGTPKGVGQIHCGDEFVLKSETLGVNDSGVF